MAESNPLVALFGDKVQNKAKAEIDVSSLRKEGGVIGIYFSAHWCPPCRGFTPKLAKFYEDFKQTSNGDKLEMIFASSDRDQSSFDEYFAEMPWLALPYDKRDIKEKLSNKFKVQGNPTLVFLDSNTGDLITANGRSVVMEDPEGKEFPWIPKPFYEVFAGDIEKKDGSKVQAETLKGKPLALYFSAHWCGPCRGFTPSLVKFYNKMKESGKEFEMVFVSSDRDEESFKEYYGEMPWLTLPFGDARKAKLSSLFEISGIPTLVILDEEGKMITDNGRGKVTKDPEGKEFPWHPKPLEELDDGNASVINEEPCLVYFTDGEDAEMEKAKKVLEPVAEEFKKSPDGSKLFFFVAAAAGDDELPDNLLQFLKIDEDALPVLALVNIPSQKKHVVDKKDVTAEVIKDVIAKFLSETLEFKNLR
ncbi:nucleoredoxin-like [Amphiura filiformis]|uniref:nucleoredoxin-like n=1 Tax=Amphiura filiformis TaxID=82378 RepID=UPI003B21C224